MRANAVAANSCGPIVFGVPRHALLGRQVERVFAALFKQPPQIAVADHSQQAVALDHRSHAQLLARHLINHIRHLGLQP